MGLKMMNKFATAFCICTLVAFSVIDVHALSTDKNQPAVISADDVEFDFSTGVRIYRGNVKLDQGTMKLRADKLIVEYKDDVLQKATAFGNPATFQQRPDGKEKDMIGKGQKMELDEVRNIVTIIDNAFIDNGEGTATGSLITYDIANDKMKIVGGATLKQEAQANSEVKQENGRSKITISAEERKKAKETKEE